MQYKTYIFLFMQDTMMIISMTRVRPATVPHQAIE